MSARWLARAHENVVRSPGFRGAAVLGAFVLALAVGYVVRLQDVRGAYQWGVVQAQALEGERQAKAMEVAGREHLNEALVSAEAHLRDARWRLSAGGDMDELLEHLAASGRTHGVSFERFEAEAPIREDDYLRLPLHMTVLGRYQALRSWLEEWSGQMRVLQVSSLSMSEAAGRRGVLQLQMAVQAFHPGEALPAPASLVDEPARAALAGPHADPFAPWSSNPAVDGLAGAPLDQLQMVGSLSRAGRTHALLAFSGRLYRVGEGDRLGRDEGIVTRVDERQLEVLERLFVAGGWQERSRYLVLHGHTGQEVTDELKAAVGVGDGLGAVDGRVGEGL